MIALYRITNITNKKTYIGWTSNLNKRWANHKFPSSQCIALRNAIQKYGHENFLFEMLTICPSESYAKLLEVAAIKCFNTKTPTGYNLTDGGDGNLGRICSEETKLKMSKTRKGKRLSKETKLKISKSHKGLKHSEEAKRKISIGHKGVSRKPFSEETKRKISDSKKGIPGKPHSEATKQKMRETRLKWWMTKKTKLI